jgi:hypothetical protein
MLPRYPLSLTPINFFSVHICFHDDINNGGLEKQKNKGKKYYDMLYSSTLHSREVRRSYCVITSVSSVFYGSGT